MRGLIRTGGGGQSPSTTDSNGNPAGNVVAEATVISNTDSANKLYEYFENAAGAADDDVLYTSGDVSMYNAHMIQNNDTMNIDVHVSLDNTTFVGPAAVQTNAVTAPGTTLVTVIAAGTVGILRGKYLAIRVDQAAAGTCEAGNVIIAHGNE